MCRVCCFSGVKCDYDVKCAEMSAVAVTAGKSTEWLCNLFTVKGISGILLYAVQSKLNKVHKLN